MRTKFLFLKKLFQNSSLIVISIIITILFCEIILRIIGFSNIILTQEDKILGYRLKPGSEGWYQDEGRAYVKVNNQGWRDIDHSKEKPNNALRIAILGDSYAEAKQVPIEKTFWYVLKEDLLKCTKYKNRNIQVINFGVSGFGTTQQYLTLNP